MRLAALALVVLAAVGAWQLRENGILLGRDADGPLEGGFSTVSGPYRPGEIGHMVSWVRGGDGHEVESARFVRVSPGLEVLGPVAYERERSGGYTDVRRWPPRGARPFDGIVLEGRENIGFGTRATKPGFYHLAGVRYRYRKGLRRFDEREDARICIQITDRLVNRCNLERDVGAFDGLAEIGGPSDYMAGRFPDGDGFGAEQVVFRMRPGGTLEFAVTISNLSGEAREVPRLDLGVGGDPGYKDPLDPLPSDPPAPFTIPAGGSRLVRVRARFAHCDIYDRGQRQTFGSIEAGEDDVELSLPVTVAGPCR